MLPGPIILAHVGGALEPHDLWTAWPFEPVTLVLLAGSGWLYGRGLTRLWFAAGPGRGVRQSEAVAFWVGWSLMALALVSPLHVLGETLFVAHMVQHELLMVVAAPLLVIGKPIIPWVWALSPRWRRRTGKWTASPVIAATWRFLTHPVVAFTLHAAALWIWHAPRLYDIAVANEAVHAAQHTSFVATALLFWWVVLHPTSAHRRTPASVAMLFGTVVHASALGAVLTLTSRVIYSAYATTTGAWGLTPMEDQQLGGLVMWVPAGMVYLVALAAVVARLMRESAHRVAWRDAARASAMPTRP